MELGPLRNLASRASARLSLGVSGETAFSLLASESSSYKVYIFNKIFMDAFRSGSNPLEVGKTLENSLIRFQEFRKRRMAVTKSFEGVVMILQPITVALLVIPGNLCQFFSSMLVSIPYFDIFKLWLE
jgi:archaellum biogenesis protein FlaJ (TadC family)